jgi:hypothetical protein
MLEREHVVACFQFGKQLGETSFVGVA